MLETVHYADRYREFVSAEAAERQQYVLAGSHLVRSGNGALLNVAPLFGPHGQLVHEHAKSHLFPFEHPLGVSEGDQMDVIELPFARVGVNICYEAEIPECAAALAEQRPDHPLPVPDTLGGGLLARAALRRSSGDRESGLRRPLRRGQRPTGPWPGAWARSAVLGLCDTGWPHDGVLAETATNIEAAAIAPIDPDLLAANRESGSATTFADRRRRSELYRTWPSHLRFS